MADNNFCVGLVKRGGFDSNGGHDRMLWAKTVTCNKPATIGEYCKRCHNKNDALHLRTLEMGKVLEINEKNHDLGEHFGWEHKYSKCSKCSKVMMDGQTVRYGKN